MAQKFDLDVFYKSHFDEKDPDNLIYAAEDLFKVDVFKEHPMFSPNRNAQYLVPETNGSGVFCIKQYDEATNSYNWTIYQHSFDENIFEHVGQKLFLTEDPDDDAEQPHIVKIRSKKQDLDDMMDIYGEPESELDGLETDNGIEYVDSEEESQETNQIDEIEYHMPTVIGKFQAFSLNLFGAVSNTANTELNVDDDTNQSDATYDSGDQRVITNFFYHRTILEGILKQLPPKDPPRKLGALKNGPNA